GRPGRLRQLDPEGVRGRELAVVLGVGPELGARPARRVEVDADRHDPRDHEEDGDEPDGQEPQRPATHTLILARSGPGGPGVAARRRRVAESTRPARAGRRRPPFPAPIEESPLPYETITAATAGGIATVCLSRRDACTALNVALGRELLSAVIELDEDPAVRCIVLTGAGRAFCGGGDVKAFADNLPRVGALIKELTTYIHGAVSR